MGEAYQKLSGYQPLDRVSGFEDEAAYFERAGVPVPDLIDLAKAEDAVRQNGVLPTGRRTVDAAATAHALPGVLHAYDTLYGLSQEQGAR